MTRTLIVLGGLLAAACGGTKDAASAGTQEPATPKAVFGNPSSEDPLFLSLERTPCFGRCPTFTIKVFRDGTAQYEGKQHVERMGRFTGRVSPELMEKLLADADAIGFWNRPAEYNSEVTDLPSTIVRVVSGERDHQVRARYNVPNDFKAFLERCEQTLQAIDWQPDKTGQ